MCLCLQTFPACSSDSNARSGFNNTNGSRFLDGPTISLCNEEELFGTISGIAPNSEISISGLRFWPSFDFTTCEYTSVSNTFSIPFHDLECNSFNDFVNGGYTNVVVTVKSPLPRCANGEESISETYYFAISKISLAIEYSHPTTDVINEGQPNTCYIDDGDGDPSITANSNILGFAPELGAFSAGFIQGPNGLIPRANVVRYRLSIDQIAIGATAFDGVILSQLAWTNGPLPTGGVQFRNISGWLNNEFDWFVNHTYPGGGGQNDPLNTANYEYQIRIQAETDSTVYPELFYSSVFTICQDAIYFQEPGSGSGTSLRSSTGTSEMLFPNPASNSISLPLSLQDEGTIHVFNATGSIVLTTEGRASSDQLDISRLSPGKYWIRSTSERGELKTHSFIKQ